MKEGYINSIDLTKIINKSRKFEFEQLQDKGLNKKDNVVLLQHKDLMKKIKKELEVLKSLGLEGERNISLGSYVDIQGQKRPCYKLNRDGMLQILNSESTIVRALTIKYINYLEEQNNDLKQDNNALYEVATSRYVNSAIYYVIRQRNVDK